MTNASPIRQLIAMLAATIALGACGPAVTRTTPTATAGAAAARGGAGVVYVAVGASETVGTGSEQGVRQAWPQLVYNDALPRASIYYNDGIPGATTALALQTELPEALAVHPTLVTVWLNVNDITSGVSPAIYEGQLDTLVHALRQRGTARVLVANTPYLDRLPAVLKCVSASPPPSVQCPTGVGSPTAGEVNARVDQYNAAIQRVVQKEGAVLVDLHAQGEVADQHPDWISADGFHPSELGYLAIAARFEAVLRSQGS
ncbi:MAG: SGNH/GDSL hydrolase family protein [Candidatus Dormibacteraeota bacterium]|nr:SGNH/GDSL hydrolase family protein [Candidatus Dormibacteraeota bacterium]